MVRITPNASNGMLCFDSIRQTSAVASAAVACLGASSSSCRVKVPYYTASHTNHHTTLHLNKNRENLRQRKFHEPLAVAGREHVSLLTDLHTWHSKLVRDTGYIWIFSPNKCSNIYRGQTRRPCHDDGESSSASVVSAVSALLCGSLAALCGSSAAFSALRSLCSPGRRCQSTYSIKW
jgi:hypothetical protein